MEETIKNVRKRDGRVVPFEIERISNAVYRAMVASKEEGIDLENDSQGIAKNVLGDLEKKVKMQRDGHIPGIEEIQDRVQINLALRHYGKTAIEFMLYRDQRTQRREQKKSIPKKVKDLVDESKTYFKSSLGEFISYRSYSRWIGEEGRRETWVESVKRYVNFMEKNLESRLTEEEYVKIEDAIKKQKVVPSMRLMWSAGEAAEATNVAAYNCSYLTPKELKDFGEVMYLLMCTAGVGFSVENQFIHQLPIIHKQRGRKKPAYIVTDSKEGWANALVEGLETWHEGYDVDFDYSKIRPTGARLKTMGGRSSGPEVLEVLLDYTRNLILDKKNQGKRLRSIDVHDLKCGIGEVAVAGGVRRSALISLSDLEDNLMRDAKKGEFWNRHPQRQLANNSAVYEEKPSPIEFMREWLALAESGTGERGIFNRGSLNLQLPERRLSNIGDNISVMGINPCGEIYLIPKQFCNLSGIVARSGDTRATLLEKIELATILGTYQSTLTDFPYLSSEWKENTERERLLGVSITGFMDSKTVQNPKILRELNQHAIEVNKYYAKRFGINASNAVTCVKPSGNSSELVNSSSGGHPRWSEYYIRNVEISAGDPLFHMLKEQGYPYYPKIGQSMASATTYVLPFPIKTPKNSILKKDLGVVEQLENWKNLKINYTEHNPSVSIYVGEDEWISAGKWVYDNWDIVGGLAFFPRSDHSYPLAPFEEIDKKTYYKMISELPKIDFSRLSYYEKEDQTSGAKEYACMGGSCEII